MAFVLSDRMRETSTAPGSGSFTVNGAVQGAQTFASVLTSNGDTTWYAATNGTGWEAGLLTRTSATVYARTTIFASSNSGSAVNFSSGTVDVFCDMPGSRAKILERLAWSAAAITPPTNDGTALGTTALMFSDLFLADGGVINWNNGDVLATQSTNALAFTGASSGYSFDALLNLSGAAAGQISFPATQNASAGANTLDDYEEGTFTAGISFGGGTTGITYGSQVGEYTKIGNRVAINLNVVLTSKGSSTGQSAITGLPFALNAGSYYACAFYSISMGSSRASWVGIPAITNASHLNPYYLTTAGAAGVAPAQDTDFSNTSQLVTGFVYKT